MVAPGRPEDLVALRIRRAAEKGGTKVRINVFPDDLPLAGHFEKAPKG